MNNRALDADWVTNGRQTKSNSVLHITNNSSRSSDRILGIYKESVELTFVYLSEGCGKTLSEINDTIPHTRIDMGCGYAERHPPLVSIRK